MELFFELKERDCLKIKCALFTLFIIFIAYIISISLYTILFVLVMNNYIDKILDCNKFQLISFIVYDIIIFISNTVLSILILFIYSDKLVLKFYILNIYNLIFTLLNVIWGIINTQLSITDCIDNNNNNWINIYLWYCIIFKIFNSLGIIYLLFKIKKLKIRLKNKNNNNSFNKI